MHSFVYVLCNGLSIPIHETEFIQGFNTVFSLNIYQMKGVDDEDDDNGEEEVTSQEEDYAEDAMAANDNDVAKKEVRIYEAAQRERQELMASEKAEFESKLKGGDNSKLSEAERKEHRMQYLLAQSEVFAHFLAGSVAADSKKKKNKKGGGRSKGRMSEAAEDAALMKTAQSKRQVTRLLKQPSNLASFCKMHPYQLEGLNWLIRLHDNGINGILGKC